MKTSFMKRLYKIKERLYLEAKYLGDFGFEIGQPIQYEIDHLKKQITVKPTTESKKRVAKTTQKTGKTVPVIDIKGEDVRTFFAQHQKIEVEIRKGKILFSVVEESVVQATGQVVCLEEAKQLFARKQYSVSVNEFAKVVNFEQMSIFDLFQAEKNDTQSIKKGTISTAIQNKAIKMLSLFSGCGSMDKGFVDEGGYKIVFANDRYEKKALRDYHIQTYQRNIGDHISMRDVLSFEEEEIPEVYFVAAGVPCVTFSALNTLTNFRDSKSNLHPLVEKTINIIKWSKAKAFLIENVENFLTVKKGIMLERFKEMFPGFGITAKVIDSAQLGSAQKRRRAFIFGLQGAVPEMELPHLSEYRTVNQAFEGIDQAPQQDMHFHPTPKTLERIKWVPQGGNILDVPEELRAPNKKFSNYCQRLLSNGQSPTITHVHDEVFIHPSQDRYLTVRETARLFSLPDDFTFTGSLTAIFEMLKNAVDYRVSRFLAKTIKAQLLPIM